MNVSTSSSSPATNNGGGGGNNRNRSRNSRNNRKHGRDGGGGGGDVSRGGNTAGSSSGGGGGGNGGNGNSSRNRNRRRGRRGRSNGDNNNSSGGGGNGGGGGGGVGNVGSPHSPKKLRGGDGPTTTSTPGVTSTPVPDEPMEDIDVLSPLPPPATNGEPVHSHHEHKSRTSSTTRAQMTTTPFSTLSINANVKRALAETLKYQFMTKVQDQTLPTTLDLKTDVIAKAKTGTGKTISFLLPSIETALLDPARTTALILSPTRELAQQIEEEALALLSKMPRGTSSRPAVTTASFVGGIKITKDFAKLRKLGHVSILVATPGRIIDHLENHTDGLDLSDLRTLVFDEADRLLDMGFRPSIERILAALPPNSSESKRQVLLFSATLPPSVEEIAALAMGTTSPPRRGGGGRGGRDRQQQQQQQGRTTTPPMKLIDTIGDEESTHKHTPQFVQTVTLDDGVTILYRLLRYHMDQHPRGDYKVMVFFATARQTQLYAEIFSRLFPRGTVLEMHSRKSQSVRNKCADTFRESSGGHFMFSSDVSARGMDYPDVTCVVQFGLPDGTDQYTHRVGRAGRGGSAVGGVGYLLLHDFERRGFLRDLSKANLSVEEAKPFPPVPNEERDVAAAVGRVSRQTLSSAYQASLGFYLSNMKKIDVGDKADLVAMTNEWICGTLGYGDEPPSMQARTVGKMNLKGVPGLNVERGGGGGGRGGGRGMGGGGRGRNRGGNY